jgi:hypothetical protein
MAWVGSVSERANQPAGGRAARPATR